jgi:hypothetical protein
MTKKRKKVVSTKLQKPNKYGLARLNSVVIWLATTGILAIISKFSFDYYSGNVELRFIKPVGRGYEFEIINNRPTDQLIEKLTVKPDLTQKFLFKVTENTPIFVDEGEASLLGGNVSYIPAAEYREMNNQIIKANSSRRFKIPPLTSRNYLEPEYMAVSVNYEAMSNNFLLEWLDQTLAQFEYKNFENTINFVVSENYWSEIDSHNDTSIKDTACRDDDMLGKSGMCDNGSM